MKKNLKKFLGQNASRLLIIPILAATSTAYCLTGKCADGSTPRNGIAAYTKEALGKTAIVYTDDLTEVLGFYEIKDVCPNGTFDIWNASHEWCIEYGTKPVKIQLVDAKG